MTDPIPPFNSMLGMGSMIPWKNGHIIGSRHAIPFGGTGGGFNPFSQ
jgi:hypothetical protein